MKSRTMDTRRGQANSGIDRTGAFGPKIIGQGAGSERARRASGQGEQADNRARAPARTIVATGCRTKRHKRFWQYSPGSTPLTGMEAGLLTTTTSSSMCITVIGSEVTGTSCLQHTNRNQLNVALFLLRVPPFSLPTVQIPRSLVHESSLARTHTHARARAHGQRQRQGEVRASFAHGIFAMDEGMRSPRCSIHRAWLCRCSLGDWATVNCVLL